MHVYVWIVEFTYCSDLNQLNFDTTGAAGASISSEVDYVSQKCSEAV